MTNQQQLKARRGCMFYGCIVAAVILLIAIAGVLVGLHKLKNVVNTPMCEIGFKLLNGGKRAVVVSVIDNLLKGAASQAVQNFNRMCGYPETEGLQ